MQPDFSPAVLAETAGLRGAALPDGSSRDLRDLLWASIDNDDSRDLDQLSVAEPLAAGAVKVLVAIADVDAIVKQGSPTDDHARTNTTSVYTAAEVFPMLPERLSTDLTSLGEGEDRVAIVVEMQVDAEGLVTGSEVYRGLVRNHAKLAYDSVAAFLDGRAMPPRRVSEVPGMDEQLRLQGRVAKAMKQVRHRHGALTLETLEARAVFEGESIADLRPEEKNSAKDLIEDFMIAANGVVAHYLLAQGYPALRRVLRRPERWERIVALAADRGEQLPQEPDATALEAFLARQLAADRSRFPDLSLSVIKLLGKGEYALVCPGETVEGHFGLAVQDYTHSTAPNRRFPDLVNHRLVKAALLGARPTYRDEELTYLAEHCTAQENHAAKVERQVKKCAAALLLASRVGEHFDALVTGAAPKGTWVRLARPPVEGRLVRGFEGLDVGDRVRVELVGTNVERGFIDFARAKEAA